MISVTDSAVKKVEELMKAEASTDDEMALRVEVRSGGCSGNSYEIYFDSKVNADDKRVNYGDVVVVMDSSSASLMEGATLDYKDGLLDAGFSIENPSAQRTCGCGKSFN